MQTASTQAGTRPSTGHLLPPAYASTDSHGISQLHVYCARAWNPLFNEDMRDIRGLECCIGRYRIWRDEYFFIMNIFE